MAISVIDYDRLVLKNGGRFDYWVINAAAVSAFINKNKLKAIPAQSYQQGALKAGAKELGLLKPQPIPGGIKAAHLHFRGEVYAVNEAQWKQFSGAVLENVKSQLANVKSLPFENTMELAEVAGGAA
jgi:hypothetical protein